MLIISISIVDYLRSRQVQFLRFRSIELSSVPLTSVTFRVWHTWYSVSSPFRRLVRIYFRISILLLLLLFFVFSLICKVHNFFIVDRLDFWIQRCGSLCHLRLWFWCRLYGPLTFALDDSRHINYWHLKTSDYLSLTIKKTKKNKNKTKHKLGADMVNYLGSYFRYIRMQLEVWNLVSGS